MLSGLRLREVPVLALLLFAQIRYCISSNETNSDTNPLLDIPGQIIKGIGQSLPACSFDHDSVSIYQYSKDSPYGVHTSEDDIDAIKESAGGKCLNLSVTVHGFTSAGNSTEFYQINRQCIQKPFFLCVSLDWSVPACTTNISNPLLQLPQYPSAVQNTRDIGEKLAKFVIALNEKGVCLESINFVGHSLGAHVCGFAAKFIFANLGRLVDIIIGLDPASPLFADNDEKNRLAKTDASQVHIVHTSFVGIQKCIGTSDTYVNGGHRQPGCVGNEVMCSHTFALRFFKNCIIDCKCLATPYKPKDAYCPPSYFARPLDPLCCTKGTCSCLAIGLGASCRFNATGLLGIVTPEMAPYCNSNVTDPEQCPVNMVRGE